MPLISHAEVRRYNISNATMVQGVVECWDTRVRKRAAAIQAAMGFVLCFKALYNL